MSTPKTQEHPPLVLPDDNWRSRWLYAGARPTVLHRISAIDWGASHDWGSPDEMIDGAGVAVCGRSGYWQMPGIFSRLCLKRCERCCERLGIPQGTGAPWNDLNAEWRAA